MSNGSSNFFTINKITHAMKYTIAPISPVVQATKLRRTAMIKFFIFSCWFVGAAPEFPFQSLFLIVRSGPCCLFVESVQVVSFNHANQFLGVSLIGGIAQRFEAVGPFSVIRTVLAQLSVTP